MIKLNECYCMDNLELLKQINNDLIDLIYCDILYNTGQKFRDYDDNLGTPQQAIEWYRPRLIEMKRALKDTGSIYLQCDYRLVHYLKIEMDNIFSIKNFRNEIIWCYRQGGRDKNTFARKHDTILFYSKSNTYTFNADNVRMPYNGTGGYVNNNNGNVVNGKRYKPNPLGKIPEDWWDIPALTPTDKKERVNYNTQKPKALVKRIIEASSNEGDVIADFFCGSGTTGVVAKELKRQYILCDTNEKAIQISQERINKLMKEIIN